MDSPMKLVEVHLAPSKRVRVLFGSINPRRSAPHHPLLHRCGFLIPLITSPAAAAIAVRDQGS
ncbi:hypothetical protein AKJ16_DCAP20350 [Drosera capensis]